VLAVLRDVPISTDRLNVNGGAIALGHPIGCTGARIVVTLLHELERRGAKRGLATLCVSGGMGMALAIERCE
jgi:acetyl-CoA C-acetyltransferase